MLLYLFKKTNTSYAYVTRTEVTCTAGMVCNLDMNYISSDGSISLCCSTTSGKFTIHSIVNDTFVYMQNIALSQAVANSHPLRGNHLVISSLSLFFKYDYDAVTNLYVMGYFYLIGTAANLAYSHTVDGNLLVLVYQTPAGTDFTLVQLKFNTISNNYVTTSLSLGYPIGTSKYTFDISLT